DFTGTVINTSKWIEYDTGATNVAQNGNITVTGTQYLTHMTRGISSSSTFDRTLADLIIEADVTFTDCGHRGGIYYSAWGGLPADSIVLMRNSGGWILLKGSLTTSTGVTGATCTNNVATHVKLVIKAAGGAEAYLDNAVTPGGTLTAEQVPNTINNKNVNFSGTYDTGALTADNFLVYNSFSAPGAPTTTIIYPGDTQATVLWDAPADDGSAAISDYVVEYKLSSSLSWSTFNDGTSVSTRATVTGLTNLTAYDFRVFAVNSVGTGYPSDSSSTTPDLAAPNPPTNVVATAGEGQVSLGWTASEDNGSAVTDYIIQYKKGSDSYSTFNDGTSTNTSTIVTGLTNGLQYSFKITATNSFGNSGPSEIVTTTPVLVAATAPTAVNIAVTGFATLYEQLSATYEYIDPNADIEGATTFRWLRANTSGGTYSAIAGETDNTYVLGPDDLGKYIKFEVTAISTTTPVNGTPVLSSATGSIGAEMDYINHLLSTGQSLAVGLNGSPVLSATQPYENLMLDGTSLVPLVETSVETMGSAMGNMITNLVVGNNYQVAVSNHGVSATGYQGLKKGTAPYLNGMDQVTKAKAAAEVLSTPYRVLGVTVVHGEGDSISGGTVSYEGWLQQWQIDYETDVKAISGQVGTIPLYTDQMSSQTGNNMAVSGMPLAQLSAAENNPGKIILVGPKYRYPYVDNVHLTNQGYRMMGEYFGKVIKKVAVDRETWTPLSPSRVERSTNVIYAQFNVPVSPIVFDTTIVSARSNYGFEYSDSTNSASISSVEILNSDTVKVTLSATPTGTSQQLRYAYTGVAGSNPGPQNAGSAAGNLRDSDTTTALSGNVLYNWSVHFAKDITADVTTPVVSSVVQNNNSNSATFAWSTNEVGSTIVEYGVTSSYGYSTTETDQATRVLAHSASLSNLLSCTKYFYQVKSNDFAHNAGSGSGSFTTDGCTASAEIVAQTGSEITTAAGGTLNFDYDSKTFSIVVPVGFSETDATFQIKQFASDAIFAVTSKPTGMLSVGSNVFDLKSFSTATTSVTSFDENISITMEYTDSEISGIDESTLTIYRYDGSNWYALDSCVVDTSANSVTCQTASFSIFGLFGQEAQAATTPTSGGSSMPPEAFLSPIAPAGSFRVSVKENQPIVTSLVTLLFNGGNDVARVAISNSPDFQSASQALYKPEFTWNICNNNTANCTGGMHTIYIKFYTHYGVASEIITSVVDYKPTNNKLTAYFTSCLNKVNSSIMYNSLRNKKADVISLQVFLRENEGFTSLKTNGLYDAQTRKAVIAFQEKYAKDVLVPFGLKKGNGNVLSMTLKKINSLVCPTPTKATIAPTCFKFTKNLSKGSVNAEVKSVKQFLDGYGYAVGIINNIFDGNLFTAVKNFQKDYANEILKPLGIKNPTGMWYTSSIKKANQLLECIK
ncbi:MAG: fibronectin type III domain-containing protein, partial [Candidatus Magasanikbacteria bacterium]